MRIAIIDDEEFYLREVKYKIEQYQKVYKDIPLEVDTFSKGKEFFTKFKESTYDLVYLDIELEDINGMNLARMIHNVRNTTMIIFMTCHTNYIHQSFVVNAFQYLMKPLKEPLFYTELRRAIKTYRFMRKSFVFSISRGNIIFNVNDIIYLETAYKSYKIHTTRGVYYGSLKTIRHQRRSLPEYNFVKIQRSFLVNMAHIKKVENVLLYMSDDNVLIVSKKRYKDFKRIFYQYLEDKK